MAKCKRKIGNILYVIKLLNLILSVQEGSLFWLFSHQYKYGANDFFFMQ